MTQFLRIGNDSIEKAAGMIRNGGIVAFPTDTVYGLGCDPFNASAVEKLVRVKARGKSNFPVLVSDIGTARELGVLNGLAEDLAARFWPGPLTIVVHGRRSFPLPVTGPSLTVGLRIPGRDDLLQLVAMAGRSLIGTSANISGMPSLRRAEDVMGIFEGKIDLVLDGGITSLGLESTVVRVRENGVEILREGAIGRERIGHGPIGAVPQV